jgi:hypothetical protein
MSKAKAPVRPVNVIASEIRKDWYPNVNFAAKDYLDAMGTLNSVNDNYIHDSGRRIVGGFLCNASTWRGEVARRVKKELNAMIK